MPATEEGCARPRNRNPLRRPQWTYDQPRTQFTASKYMDSRGTELGTRNFVHIAPDRTTHPPLVPEGGGGLNTGGMAAYVSERSHTKCIEHGNNVS